MEPPSCLYIILQTMYCTHFKMSVWESNIGFRRRGKEEMKGHREVREIGQEGIVLSLHDMLL